MMDQDKILEQESQVVAEIKRLSEVAVYFYRAADGDRNSGSSDLGESIENNERRYRDIRAESIRLASTISDDFYKSAAIHFLIGMLVQTKDIALARNLLKQVKIDMIRKKIVSEFPEIKKKWLYW